MPLLKSCSWILIDREIIMEWKLSWLHVVSFIYVICIIHVCMHEKMIGRVSFIITGIILSIHGLCKISVCKMWYYKRSKMKSILMWRKTWGSKREKSGGTALQKKSFLMPEKKYVGLQLDEKLRIEWFCYENFTTFIWGIVRFCDAITYSLFWWKGR